MLPSFPTALLYLPLLSATADRHLPYSLCLTLSRLTLSALLSLPYSLCLTLSATLSALPCPAPLCPYLPFGGICRKHAILRTHREKSDHAGRSHRAQWVNFVCRCTNLPRTLMCDWRFICPLPMLRRPCRASRSFRKSLLKAHGVDCIIDTRFRAAARLLQSLWLKDNNIATGVHIRATAAVM